MSKPVSTAWSESKVLINMLAPARRMKDAAICVMAKMRRRRPVLPVMRTLPLARPSPLRRFGGRQTRNEREQNRGDDRQDRADPEHAGVDGEVERADGEARSVAREDCRPSGCATDNAEQRSGAAQQQAFREQRAAQRAGGGAERGANREFAFAADAARQNQIGDVGARNHEDQQRRSQQDQRTVFAPEVICRAEVTAEMRVSAVGE